MSDYQPRPEHRFTFGLWTVGNRGRDPFGDFTRKGFTPVEIVENLGRLGAYGVNFHDNDLIPIDATPAERLQILSDFKKALEDNNLCVPMATTNLFTEPVFKDGAFTSLDPRVRAYALQKTMRAIDLGVELGAHTYVFWGGREGAEVDISKGVPEALKWYRECINFLCGYVKDNGYNLNFALEAKPNEPRGDIYLATTGHMLAFIETLDFPEMVGVNPEFAHEQMAGLNVYHGVAQAWEAGKLFHIDLNDQKPGRFDQDLRFGSENIKASFLLVKFLEEVGYDGPRHFDAHAYRSEDPEGVWDFAAGCMRTYLILKEKARKFQEDAEIQALLEEIHYSDRELEGWMSRYTPQNSKSLLARSWDRHQLAAVKKPYERLDQLLVDLLLGVR
ncbi:MAG TPA: xylose isomerase [Acidobacteriota bacterium]|nr:xylose isomerase [Acidobacteriota bacterium]